MKLIPISGQAGANFVATFRKMAEGSKADNPNMATRLTMMSNMIEHLENNVVGPDIYAFQSMDGLVLSDEDSSQYRLITVYAGSDQWCVPDGYEIAYRTTPPWFHTIGYSKNVVAAGELVLEAIRLAVRGERD